MYLVPIHVPIYQAGDQLLVTTEWKRSLELLRDSFDGRFWPLVVVAPAVKADGALEQRVERVDSSKDGIDLRPSVPFRHRARDYWLKYRRQWMADCASLMDDAAVVHAGINDVYRPFLYDAWRLADRRGLPTVFVQDTDIVLRVREEAAQQTGPRRMTSLAYARIYERWCRKGVSRASLSLLKGRMLHERYGRFALNAKDFHDTSHLSEQVVNRQALALRTASLDDDRPLRLVYCGRLIERKGVDDAIRIVAAARGLGARIAFDIIGDGPQRADLERRVHELGVGSAVQMIGALNYGQQLLDRLAGYDALLFTPPLEDTPRMIFDGYAAGLPLIATDIAYVRERSDAEGATVLLPRGDRDEAARRLARLDQERRRLAELAVKAREAGVYHAADKWYRRRAEWTIEACAAARGRAGVLAV